MIGSLLELSKKKIKSECNVAILYLYKTQSSHTQISKLCGKETIQAVAE